MIEIIGIIASILIVFSMAFRTTSFKGTILMRIINGVGSIFFVIYGFLIPAYSTGVTNIFAFFLNLYWLIKECKDHKKENV